MSGQTRIRTVPACPRGTPCEGQETRPPCLDPIDDKSIPNTDANQFSIPRIALRMNVGHGLV